ncbi:hypothetical protein Goarm_022591 [Gossypium armourianum]|uniref:Uncharacterized protein n=1 Tax=Gossypium armourianum TaxID=34283 RepID=A0A7J9KGM1_9ROSI|nr:hypothetical protein [Gossypium armourianum]
MTSWKRNGWQFFRIFKKKTSSGELLSCFRIGSKAMVTKRRFERCPMHGTRIDG